MQGEHNENMCLQNQSNINETDTAIEVQDFLVVKFTDQKINTNLASLLKRCQK